MLSFLHLGSSFLPGGEMKEQLISLLTSKVGLDAEKANQAVDTILEYIKSNPQQITEYMGKLGIDGAAEKLGGFFGG